MSEQRYRKHFDEASGHCGPWKHFRGGRGGFWGEMAEGWGRHGRRPFGAEFGGRQFDTGELRLVVLSYIAEKPSHGYEIMKGIGEKMGGTYTPSAGVIYPTLNQLEDEGLATVASEGGKKQYTITEAGLAELNAQKGRIDEILGRIREVGEAYGSRRAPGIMRAMHNCRLALKLKFGRGDLSADRVEKIAKILDDAAKEIERV
ncbi:MAG TPA: PadR family transcriptional regulator [Silvibacterium sp.]|jgi:DNA-binding PadR family transcriptional regulator|nr:PadR family transcriptional regulator [Silvibacterium sp.]